MPFLFVAPASAQFDPLASTCFEENGDVKANLIEEDGSIPAVCQEALNQQGEDNPLTGQDGTLTRVANILAVVTGVIAVIIIVVAGITMTLSNGDSGKVQSSRNAIIYATVGLVVVALARSIVIFVINRV